MACRIECHGPFTTVIILHLSSLPVGLKPTSQELLPVQNGSTPWKVNRHAHNPHVEVESLRRAHAVP
jgi:hypothetical protein